MDEDREVGELSRELATLERLRESGRHSLLHWLAQEPGSPLHEVSEGRFIFHKGADLDLYDQD